MRQALATLAVLLAIPSAASAATVQVKLPSDYGAIRLVYRAAPGETNDVQLTMDGVSVVVSDTGAGVQAGRGCRQEGPNLARCSPPEGFVNAPESAITILEAELGDRADSLRNSTNTTYLMAFVDGGAGDDRLVGGSYFDIFDGGPGRDHLDGAGGGDSLSGGSGVEADVLIGGDAVDSVSYEDRTARVTVDLRGPANPSGETAEGDSLQGIENAQGGRGPDVLRAGAAAARLVGNFGNDRLMGGFGNDVLMGESGDDKLYGEGGSDRVVGGSGDDALRAGCGRAKLYGDAGNDRLYSRNGSFNRVFGGGGRDTAQVDQLDVSRQVERRVRERVDACAL